MVRHSTRLGLVAWIALAAVFSERTTRGLRCRLPLVWKAKYMRQQVSELVEFKRNLSRTGVEYMGKLFVDAVHGRTAHEIHRQCDYEKWSPHAKFFIRSCQRLHTLVYRVARNPKAFHLRGPPGTSPETADFEAFVEERSLNGTRGFCQITPQVTLPRAQHFFLRAAAFHRLPVTECREFRLGGARYVEIWAADPVAGQAEWWRFHAHREDGICRPVAYQAAVFRPNKALNASWQHNNLSSGLIHEALRFEEVSISSAREVASRTVPDARAPCQHSQRHKPAWRPPPKIQHYPRRFVRLSEVVGPLCEAARPAAGLLPLLAFLLALRELL